MNDIDLIELASIRQAWVYAAPADVYRLVSDVPRSGRWSPNASDVAFDEGAGPEVGAWSSGSERHPFVSLHRPSLVRQLAGAWGISGELLKG